MTYMLWYVLNKGTVSWPHRHVTLLQKCPLAVLTGLASMLILFTCLPFTVSITLMYWCLLLNKSFIVHKQCSEAWTLFQCFVLILFYVLQKVFQTNYPSAVPAIGMCYHLRKHSHASLSVSLYHSLM